MIGSFSFNGIESSEFGLVCKSIKRPLLPAVKSGRTEMIGTSGIYDFSENEYSTRSLVMRIAYIGTTYEELRTRARSIAAWLSTSSWVKLILNDENDKYYLAKIVDEIDLESLWGSGTADISFDCQPFAYSVDEEILVADSSSYEFTNQGTRLINYKSPYGSKSLIQVVGSWTTLTLSMNGKTLTYGEAVVNKTLIIDNIEMEAKLDGVNKFSVLSGDIDTFLTILPGENTLAIGGTGLSAVTTIKFIPIWI